MEEWKREKRRKGRMEDGEKEERRIKK